MNNTSPILIVLISFAAGILSGYLIEPIWGSCILLLLSICIALLINIKSRNSFAATRLNKFNIIWIFMLFASLGMLNQYFHRPTEYDPENEILPIYLIGTVKESDMQTNGCRMIVNMEYFMDSNGNKKPCGNLKTLVYHKSGAEKFDYIRIPALLCHLDSIKTIGQKSFYNSLKDHNILYRISVPDNELSVIGRESSILSLSGRIRDNLAIMIEKSSLDAQVRNFLISVLLGDRSYLDFQTKQKFSEAGLAHILALSGVHIAIVSSIILILLLPLNLMVNYKYRFFPALALIWLYAFITGLSIPTLRATIMISIALLATIFERKENHINTLALATFIILLLQPESIFDIGFILSVTSVGVILVFPQKLNVINRHNHPKTYGICNVIICTLVVFASTWILIAYHFHFLPLISFIPNIIVLPLLPVYLTISFIYIFLLPFGIDSIILRYPLEKCYYALISFIDNISGSEGALESVYPGLYSVILWLVGIILFAFFLYNKRNRKTVVALGSFSLIISLILLYFPIYPERDGIMISRTTDGRTRVTSYIRGETKSSEFPPGKISIYNYFENKIAYLDTPFETEVLDRLADCNIVVITDRSKSDFSKFSHFNKNTIFIFHSSNHDFDRTLAFKAKKEHFRTHVIERGKPFIMHF